MCQVVFCASLTCKGAGHWIDLKMPDQSAEFYKCRHLSQMLPCGADGEGQCWYGSDSVTDHGIHPGWAYQHASRYILRLSDPSCKMCEDTPLRCLCRLICETLSFPTDLLIDLLNLSCGLTVYGMACALFCFGTIPLAPSVESATVD